MGAGMWIFGPDDPEDFGGEGVGGRFLTCLLSSAFVVADDILFNAALWSRIPVATAAANAKLTVLQRGEQHQLKLSGFFLGGGWDAGVNPADENY